MFQSKFKYFRNETSQIIRSSYLRCPLLAIDESGFGMPLREASCCSNALDSKYSSHAAASCRKK